MENLAQMYNVPMPILEVVNPHIQNLTALTPGTIAYIPRLDKMHCQKMYMEQPASDTGTVSQMYSAQQPLPCPGTLYSMYGGQQTAPYYP